MSWHQQAEAFYRAVNAFGNGPVHWPLRCPLVHDLRDWLHRLDAHGSMCGHQLSESLGYARGDSKGYFESDAIAERILASLERAGWIVRERRGDGAVWVAGPAFDLQRFELWVRAGGPQDGAGMFPTSWGLARGEQGILDLERAA